MTYVLHPAQSQIASDQHRFRVVNCGRRFGKTALAVLEMVAKAVSQDDRRVCYVAPTYQQARDIAWVELKRIAKPVADSINESRLEITVKTQDGGKSLITLRGWESIETLRGQKFDFVVIDEIASMRNFWEGWYEVVRPTLTDRKGEGLFISTPKGFNHFYDLYNLEGQDSDFKSFHFTTWDNPHIPREEIKKAESEVPSDQFAQEYMADFRKQQGLVYKEFSREKHVVADADLPTTFVQVITGLDAGFTNPTAFYIIKRDLSNTYWITSEWYKSGQTEGQVVEYVASTKHDLCYPDPEAAALCEALRRAGVPVREVNKGKDSIINGIAKVRELLLQGKLKVHNSCINLIEEFETYAYPDKRPDQNEPEVPIKQHDHALDAIRYALMSSVVTSHHTVARRYIPKQKNAILVR